MNSNVAMNKGSIILVVAVILLGVISVTTIRKKNAELLRANQVLQQALDQAKSTTQKSSSAPLSPSSRTESPVSAPGSAPGMSLTPEQILDRLKAIKVTTGTQRIQSVRRVIHYLESLVDAGPAAFPAIREFLSRFEDVDYSYDTMSGGEMASGSASPAQSAPSNVSGAPPDLPGGRSSARLDFVLPPSLRLGLIDVLKQIGGGAAEEILAEVLSTSGRGVEVAYAARALQEMVSDKYREVALAAAKDLLSNPPSIDRPNRLDEQAKSYLYGVLAVYGDASFATTAQGLIIGANGQLDRSALNYFITTMKDQGIAGLYQAFNDARLTNVWDKASLAGHILNYAGENRQANAIFREIVTNESLPSWMRALTINNLAGGGFLGGANPTDTQQIQARLHLLSGLPEFNDERLTRARYETIERLNHRLKAKNPTGSSPQGAQGENRALQLETPLPGSP